MESQMKYPKVLTTLGLLVTVVLAGELLNPKKSLAVPYPYQVVNDRTRKCLDADFFNGRNGAVVQMWQCTNLDNQKWRFHGDGSIESARYPGMCLDADYFTGGNGTRIKLWRCATAINGNNANHQKWEVFDGKRIRNKQFFRYLDADLHNPRNGAVVQLWQYTGVNNQWWIKRP